MDGFGGGQQDILSAALDECGLGDFFANPVVQDDLAKSLPSSPLMPTSSFNTLSSNGDETIYDPSINPSSLTTYVEQPQQQQQQPLLQNSNNVINANLNSSQINLTSSSSSSSPKFTTTVVNHSSTHLLPNQSSGKTNIQISKINSSLTKTPIILKRIVLTKNPATNTSTNSTIASSRITINSNQVDQSKVSIISPILNGQTKTNSQAQSNVILNDISNQKGAIKIENILNNAQSGSIVVLPQRSQIFQIVSNKGVSSPSISGVNPIQRQHIIKSSDNVVKVRLTGPNTAGTLTSTTQQTSQRPITVIDQKFLPKSQSNQLLDSKKLNGNCDHATNDLKSAKAYFGQSNGTSLISPSSLSRSFSKSLEQSEFEKNILLSEEMRRLLEEVNEDELANLETFSDYMPAKLKLGLRHPDQVVETSSLASIPPPDVWYNLRIPEEVWEGGALSALQLESIIYASQQHENFLPDGSRAGFLIGDGAGVGKGRTVAGIIYENYLRGRKRALWFSVSTDLKYDAVRDLFDIGANKIEVHLLNKFKYGIKIHSPDNDNVKRGVIFATYHSLIGESTTYSGRFSTRFDQILQWCGEDFDGVIIFDECHKAKNLFPNGTTRATKTGQAVLDLQKRLPKARVVYASATGATEPKNMGYMTRLGIWGPGTPFEDFNQFVSMVEKRGVGAMELVAIDLKMRGMYMARQLSFKGVHFRIEHVPLSREFIRIYNCCCRLWVSAKTKFEKALELMNDEPQVTKAVWTQFWASHQRFFKYLCIASKVKFAVAFVKEALRCDKAVVIGLQSTGEARTLEQLEDSGGELNDFVSTAKSVFQTLIERHFPAPNRKKTSKLLGQDTSFFDELGIKLKRNANDEIVASIYDDDDQFENKRPSGKTFFDSDDDDDDFISVDEDEDEVSDKSSSDSGNDDDSDLDSDDLDEIDDIMDERLGLKPGSKPSASIKFMDILLGPSTMSKNNRKRKQRSSKRSNRRKRAKLRKRKPPKKSLKSKYEKYYGFDNIGPDGGGYCDMLKSELLEQLESFGERLPPNTLDELIDELGGPEMVAEMTGRKGRIVSTQDGQVQYEARSENDVSLEMLNLVEKQRFMNDEKRIAIISEAASSGISLHADRRAKNRCRRVHLTVELPWSADRAIQQFGRTHRSNQVSAPEYVFLISNLAGEKRFASIVAKRLESLGALTHGDRRATESRDLSQFNIDTKYGRQALEIVMKSIVGRGDLSDTKPMVPPPETYSGDFFEDCREGLAGVGLLNIDRRTGNVSLDKDYANINKFLNRILGLEVELQNSLFRYFNETMDAVVKQAKKAGRYDSGIIDLSSEVGNVQKLNLESFILKSASGAIKIQLHTVSIDRGLSFERAENMYKQALAEDDYFKDDIGFYVYNSTYQIRKTIFLAIPENPTKNNKDVKQIFRIYKPSLGLQAKYETKSSLKERGTKLEDLEQAAKLWKEHYEKSDQECTHLLLFGKCRSSSLQSSSKVQKICDVGIRKRTYCILSGAVLTVWPEIEKSIPYIQTHKLQIVRLKTEDNLKYIGPMIPPMCVDEVRKCLQQLANGKKET